MENSSRALIMAATVILAVLLIGVFIYVFRAGSSVSESYDKKQQTEQLELYNSKFELYNVETNSIMDLISVANLAYSVNIQCEYDTTNTVDIKIKAGTPTFSIPGNDRKGLQKNEIISGSANKMSIFKLATDDLDSLGVENNNKSDTLATTKYDIQTNKTIYKYLFDCKKVEYHNQNGQVSKMEFEMYLNGAYN